MYCSLMLVPKKILHRMSPWNHLLECAFVGPNLMEQRVWMLLKNIMTASLHGCGCTDMYLCLKARINQTQRGLIILGSCPYHVASMQ